MTKAPTPGVDPDDPECSLIIAVVLPELAGTQKVDVIEIVVRWTHVEVGYLLLTIRIGDNLVD